MLEPDYISSDSSTDANMLAQRKGEGILWIHRALCAQLYPKQVHYSQKHWVSRHQRLHRAAWWRDCFWDPYSWRHGRPRHIWSRQAIPCDEVIAVCCHHGSSLQSHTSWVSTWASKQHNPYVSPQAGLGKPAAPSSLLLNHTYTPNRIQFTVLRSTWHSSTEMRYCHLCNWRAVNAPPGYNRQDNAEETPSLR